MIQKSDQRLSKDGVVNGRDRREEEITKELEETMGEAISEASQVYIYIYMSQVYIPGSGRSTGGGNGNPIYSCQKNPMDREVWRGTVHRAANSQKRLNDHT